MKILVVEDEKTTSEELQKRLQTLGYTVLAAGSGEAVLKTAELHPDLVLLDISKPDNMKVVEAIGAQFAIPVVYTVHNDELQKAATREPYQYILKPFHNKDIHTTIELAFLIHERNQKNQESQPEEKYRSLVEQSLQGIAIIRNSRILFANTVFARMFCNEDIIGYPLEEVLASVHPEDRAIILQQVCDCTAGKSVQHTRVRVICCKEEQWLELLVTCIQYGGEPALQVVVGDITERKKMEEVLLRSEEKFKRLFELFPDGIVTLDMKGVITSCNTATTILTGFSKDEIVGKHISKLGFLRARDIPRYLKLFSSIIRGKEPDIGEVIWHHKDGTPHRAEIRVKLLEEGRTVGILVVTRDITARKRAEEQLRESEEKYKNIVRSAPDGILTFDVKGVVTSCNTAYTRLTGFSEEEIVGKHFTKLPVARMRDIPRYVKVFNSLVRGKAPEPFEFEWIHKDGTTHMGEAHISLMKRGRKTTGFQAISRDITQRKKAKEALQSERDKLKALFEGLDRTGIGIDILGVDYKVLHQNEVLREEFGDLTGKLCYEEYIGLEEPCDFCPMVKAVENNTVESAEFVDLHGRHMELISAPLPNPDGTVDKAIEVAIDNTERIKAQKALQESEEQLRNLFENAVIGIYRTTPEGCILMANPALVRMLGYSSYEELAQRNLEKGGFEPRYPRSTFKQRIESEGEIAGLESVWIKRDGTPLFIRENARAVRDTAGTTLYYEGTVEDITEHKKAEEQIKASLKEKEVLLQEIHHRVKNNLQVISSLLSLQSTYTKDDKYTEMFKESQNRIKTMALIHEKLYQSENLASIDFTEYIRALAHSLFLSYEASTDRVALKTEVDTISLGIDTAIPCGLIINELVSNSLKHAFPDRKGEIIIKLRSIDGTIQLTVADNGVGIPDTVDFRNTESLGLRLVTLLAEGQLHGEVKLSRNGGTEFCITFQAESY